MIESLNHFSGAQTKEQTQVRNCRKLLPILGSSYTMYYRIFLPFTIKLKKGKNLCHLEITSK